MFGNDALNPHLEFLITSSLFRYIRIQIISRLSKAEEEEVGDDKQKGCDRRTSGHESLGDRPQ